MTISQILKRDDISKNLRNDLTDLKYELNFDPDVISIDMKKNVYDKESLRNQINAQLIS